MAKVPRSLFDEVLELAVYVPVGIAVRVLEQVPGLAAAGRDRVGGQVEQARVIGRFAVGLARTTAARSQGRATARPSRPAAPAEPTPEPPAPSRSTSRSSTRDAGDEPGPPVPAPGVPAPGASASGRPASPPQAIPDYDALSASQVVPRLVGLTRDELATVGSYEATTRRRRTILNRVAQLERELGGH